MTQIDAKKSNYWGFGVRGSGFRDQGSEITVWGLALGSLSILTHKYFELTCRIEGPHAPTLNFMVFIPWVIFPELGSA